jgi:hypothetical protein
MWAATTQERWNNEEGGSTLIDWTPEENATSQVDTAANVFMALSVDKRAAVVGRISGGESEDFREA